MQPATSGDLIPSQSSTPHASPMTLVLPRAIRRRMIDQAITALPNESVGLLATVREGDQLVATAWFPGANVDASPQRYTMDPREVRAAVDRLSAAGWSLGAIVHSHPADPAVPSSTDLREFGYPDALMGIISLAENPPDIRAWRWRPSGVPDGQRVAEVAVQTQTHPTNCEETW